MRLEAAVPGIEFETYRSGGIGIIVCVVVSLVGGCWALIGILELLGTLAFGCDILILLICVVFVALRLGIVVAIVRIMFFLLDEIQRHRCRAPLLGNSFLPASAEEAAPFDSIWLRNAIGSDD